ncbi:MAG: TolC family protein [Bacteroidetes bacterium]|nr:TolC family protein [Bacteroidota bacterium]
MYRYYIIIFISLLFAACKLPALTGKTPDTTVPGNYRGDSANAERTSADTTNPLSIKWKDYFTDPNLVALIDTALKNNQELNITLREIGIARNEIQARKGEYLPFVGLRAGAGFDKAGKYTMQGATEEAIAIHPGGTPDPLQDYRIEGYATWEADIWHKLHNAKKAAVTRYLATIEGRNFVITNLVAEIANSYYELLALDNQLDIVKKNIDIQNNALQIVRLQKEATRVTELAVRKFEAEVLKTRSIQYDILQKITVTENRINFLLGRYPRHIPRDPATFGTSLLPGKLHPGIPSQLLANRPDIKQAELELAASRLDVQVAKARFYPSLGISAAIGYQAFNPAYLLETPKSLLYSLAGDLVAPLVNRNAIKATYANANARQIQAAYNYERTILNAYVEVANQLSRIGNLQKSYDLRSQQVDALNQSISISNDLFKSARADYMEVLMTQRDALESKFELVETRQQQMNALVSVYQALGGGWK